MSGAHSLGSSDLSLVCSLEQSRVLDEQELGAARQHFDSWDIIPACTSVAYLALCSTHVGHTGAFSNRVKKPTASSPVAVD